jgi:hypothetical protein
MESLDYRVVRILWTFADIVLAEHLLDVAASVHDLPVAR